MVYRLSFAQAFTVLATLALSSTQATAAIIRERQDAPAAPDISNIINDQPDTYHWDGFDQDSEIEQYKDATKGLDLYYIREQALSIAKFDGSDEENWYWFFAKTRIAHDVQTGPGSGCQVALYYDNIKKRYDLAKENNYAATRDSSWHVPSAMSPWCSEESSALDIVIKNDNYDEKLFGYKTIRPSTDPEHEALVVLLSELGFDNNADTVNATAMDDMKPSSEHVFGNPPLIGDPQNFTPALKAAIIEEQHNIVPNPYKYPKGDPVWAKKRQDILNNLNGTDPAASSGPVTTGALVVNPVTTIFSPPPADASQVTDDAQASGSDVVGSTTVTGTDTAAQVTATGEAVVDTASASIAPSVEPTATEVTIEDSGTTITGSTAAETQSLT